MLLNFIATAAQPAGRAPVMIWLPFIFVIVIFWVLDFFTRKKNKKKQQQLLDGLVVGAKVVTIGGLIGEIALVKDDFVELKVDKGIRLQFKKNAISHVLDTVK